MIQTPEARNEIKTFVTENLGDWIVKRSLGESPVVFEIEPRERIVCVPVHRVFREAPVR
jgi:hypothetical protein